MLELRNKIRYHYQISLQLFKGRCLCGKKNFSFVPFSVIEKESSEQANGRVEMGRVNFQPTLFIFIYTVFSNLIL